MKRRGKRSVIPPLGARVSSEVIDVGPPLTPEQLKLWREERGIPDPQRPLVPTAAEVAKLPRLARRALALRCAERVQPLASGVAELEPQATAALIVAAATVQTPLRRQLRCIRRDFDRLVFLAKKHKWSDDSPVPPEVFGPLWPKDLLPTWAVATQ